jgi:hypothetical protein
MTTFETPNKGIRHDLFAAIEYEKRPGKHGGTVVGLQLPRRFVLKWAFEITWKYTSAGILLVNRHKLHSTEDLFCNAKVWSQYSVHDHRDFGRCEAYFANQPIKMLPLHCVNQHQTNKLYIVLDI